MNNSFCTFVINSSYYPRSTHLSLSSYISTLTLCFIIFNVLWQSGYVRQTQIQLVLCYVCVFYFELFGVTVCTICACWVTYVSLLFVVWGVYFKPIFQSFWTWILMIFYLIGLPWRWILLIILRRPLDCILDVQRSWYRCFSISFILFLL